MFHSSPFLSQPFQPLLPSPLKLQNFTTPNQSLMSVYVCIFGISLSYVIESIDSKLISVCLINDYSLFAVLHIFVHGSAECATISLKCKMLILLILYNFGNHYFLKKFGIQTVYKLWWLTYLKLWEICVMRHKCHVFKINVLKN
jgi:hypothetical protein